MVTQGRELRAADIDLIQGLMAEHPDWGRTRLSEALCRRWDWRNAQGRFKDMAARTLLLKLERGGLIRLPRRQRPSSNGLRNRQAPLVAHATEPIRDALGDLRPLRLSVVESGSADLQLFNCLLRRYHYLGHRNTVGENLRYLARDRAGRPLGCALFGSAAWKCAARDAFIGWERRAREHNLSRLTKQPALFWSCPGSRCRTWPATCLGLSADRFAPTGRASMAIRLMRWKPSWIAAASGEPATGRPTGCPSAPPKGRSRNDRDHGIRVSIKEVYLYPLIQDFRRELCAC